MSRSMSEPTAASRLSGIEYRLRQLERRRPPDECVVLEIKVFSDTKTVAAGDGKFIFAISEDMDGYGLGEAQAFVSTVSSSGKPTVQIRNITQTEDLLGTVITIDANEYTSYAAATPSIAIPGLSVATGDLIAVDVDVAGTGAKGLGVILVFCPQSVLPQPEAVPQGAAVNTTVAVTTSRTRHTGATTKSTG